MTNQNFRDLGINLVGQIVFQELKERPRGQDEIAADLAIHKATVKRHVAKLKKPGMLKVVRRGQKTAIYTVKNWRGKTGKAENQLDLFTAA